MYFDMIEEGLNGSISTVPKEEYRLFNAVPKETQTKPIN
jgi:hypothetical protein